LTVEAVQAKSSAAFENLTQLPSQRKTTGTGLFFPLLLAVRRVTAEAKKGKNAVGRRNGVEQTRRRI
jgi:hypothetical protein